MLFLKTVQDRLFQKTLKAKEGGQLILDGTHEKSMCAAEVAAANVGKDLISQHSAVFFLYIMFFKNFLLPREPFC